MSSFLRLLRLSTFPRVTPSYVAVRVAAGLMTLVRDLRPMTSCSGLPIRSTTLASCRLGRIALWSSSSLSRPFALTFDGFRGDRRTSTSPQAAAFFRSSTFLTAYLCAIFRRRLSVSATVKSVSSDVLLTMRFNGSGCVAMEGLRLDGLGKDSAPPGMIDGANDYLETFFSSLFCGKS
jgi:hypothetical protein